MISSTTSIPWTSFAKRDVVAGYNKGLCYKCIVGIDDVFEKKFNVTQDKFQIPGNCLSKKSKDDLVLKFDDSIS